MIRFIDVLASLFALFFSMPLLAVLWLICWLETGSPLFRQERMGRHKKPFVLVKFRTLRQGTPSLPTHLVDVTAQTFFGRYLRSSKLDELPQLWNVIKGDMSLVGPRPNLFSQERVIRAREALGVYDVRPGITGLAQINDLDMSAPKILARTDAKMISTMSIVNYFNYIFQTIAGRGKRDGLRL